MTAEALKAIILAELDLVEDELTEEQRILLAIDIALRLLDQSIFQHNN